MLATPQGLVGCDTLNGDRRGAKRKKFQYWSKLWAANNDTIIYETYAGYGTIEVQFTDEKPQAEEIYIDGGIGQSFELAMFEHEYIRRCGYWNSLSCPDGHTSGWANSYRADQDSKFETENRYHSGKTAIGLVDADDDLDNIALVSAQEPNGNVLKGTIAVAESKVGVGSSPTRIGTTALNPNTGEWLRWLYRCSTGSRMELYSSGYYRVADFWAWHGSGRTCKRPSHTCDQDVAQHELCWSLWGPDDGSDTSVEVSYRACDKRYRSAREDLWPFSRYLAGLIHDRWSHLTEYRVAVAIAYHMQGRGRPRTLEREDWQSIKQATDVFTYGRYCEPGTLFLRLGECSLGSDDVDGASLVDSLSWHTFIEVVEPSEGTDDQPQHSGESGLYPDHPGADAYVLVTGSPVWPRIEASDSLDLIDAVDCEWSAQWLRASFTQMLPWNPEHRSLVATDDRYDEWLSVWDNLSDKQRAEAESSHSSADFVTAECDVEAASDSTEDYEDNDAYSHCRWVIPRQGLWHWQVHVGYLKPGTEEEISELLTEGISWIGDVHHYTDDLTVTGWGEA